MENYKEVLNLFVGEDYYREWMMKPFQIKDKAYSTNAHIMFIAPLNKVGELSKLDKKRENDVLSVIPKLKNLSFDIAIEDLKKAIYKIPLVDEYIDAESDGECKECDGDGEVEWEYGSHSMHSDCPVCDGDGKIEETKRNKSGNKIMDNTSFIDINESRYNPMFLKKIIKASEILKTKKITLISQDNRSGSFFKIGDCELMLMPITKTDSDKVIHSFN